MEPTPQLLDFEPPVALRQDPIAEAAMKFHEENPHILREIADVALKVKTKGYVRWSIKAAYEVVRYNGAIATNGKTYKLNNNHTSFYARLLMASVPELKDFFEIREERRKKQSYEE